MNQTKDSKIMQRLPSAVKLAQATIGFVTSDWLKSQQVCSDKV